MMTRRSRGYTRSTTDCRSNSNSPGDNLRKLRPRKNETIIIDSSDDDNIDYPEEYVKTPRKDKLKIDEAVTPPKQKRIEVPTSPYPGNNTVNYHTPSTLIDRLSLLSPIRTKTSQNRKSLFPESNNLKNSATEHNDRSLSITISDDNKLDDKELGNCSLDSEDNENELIEKTCSYRDARKALHSSLPTKLPCRQNEVNQLTDFIRTHIENLTSGSMYVSGPPGTGKTASLSIILQEKKVS